MGFSIRIFKSAYMIREYCELHSVEKDNFSEFDKMTKIMQYLTKHILTSHNLQSVIIQAWPYSRSIAVTIMLSKKDTTVSCKRYLIPYQSYSKFMRILRKHLNEQSNSIMESKLTYRLKVSLDSIGYTPLKLKTGQEME